MRAQTTRKNSPNKSPYANMAAVRTSWGPRYAAFTGISSLSKDALTLQLLLLLLRQKLQKKSAAKPVSVSSCLSKKAEHFI